MTMQSNRNELSKLILFYHGICGFIYFWMPKIQSEDNVVSLLELFLASVMLNRKFIICKNVLLSEKI